MRTSFVILYRMQCPDTSSPIPGTRSLLRVFRPLLVVLYAPALVMASNLEIVAQASSDLMYHGTTETGGNPAIGLAFDWQISDHAFVGIEAHQGEVDSDPQRHRSVMVYAGAGIPLGKQWYASGTVAHREFPGSTIEWDFTEFSVALDHTRGWTLSVDYSPDYYEHNTRAWVAELGYQRDIGQRFYAYASVGALELSSTEFTDYRFGQVGGGIRWKQLVFDLSYRANSEGDSTRFGGAALSDAKFVGQLSWRLR